VSGRTGIDTDYLHTGAGPLFVEIGCVGHVSHTLVFSPGAEGLTIRLESRHRHCIDLNAEAGNVAFRAAAWQR
jgi:hypothetical protein